MTDHTCNGWRDKGEELIALHCSVGPDELLLYQVCSKLLIIARGQYDDQRYVKNSCSRYLLLFSGSHARNAIRLTCSGAYSQFSCSGAYSQFSCSGAYSQFSCSGAYSQFSRDLNVQPNFHAHTWNFSLFIISKWYKSHRKLEMKLCRLHGDHRSVIRSNDLRIKCRTRQLLAVSVDRSRTAV